MEKRFTWIIQDPKKKEEPCAQLITISPCSVRCSFAYQSGFISTEPFEGVKKLQRNRIKPDPLSKTEFNALMESEKGQSQSWKFAVYSGLRYGELAALAWEDVDLEKGIVNVRRNLTILDMFGPPKQMPGSEQ